MARNGQTIVFSTHVMQHAERLCENSADRTGRKVFDGTVAEACATIPRRVLLETAADISSVIQLPGVVSVDRDTERPGRADGDTGPWLIEIEEKVNPQDVLRHCFDHQIALSRFELSEPSLHDVFMHLVGEQAREHSFR